jgi:hypothetical protein
LNWNEVFFTNCPMVSANNVDQELGMTKALRRCSRRLVSRGRTT